MARRKKNKRRGPSLSADRDLSANAGGAAAAVDDRPAPPAKREQTTKTDKKRVAPVATDGLLGARGLTAAAVLAGIGCVLSLYLTYTKLTGAAPALCGADGGCDIVQSSRWAVLFAVPIAFWGALSYAAIAVFAWRARSKPSQWRMAAFVALVALGISIYLTGVSAFEIGAFCGWCLTSLAIIATTFVVICLARPGRNNDGFRWPVWLGSSGLMTVALVTTLHLHWAGFFNPASGPEDPYLRGLAEHLEASGARFYGAYWCPACQRQKAEFEASVERLPYVECSPNGRGTPMSTVCQSRQIQNFPTWIIDGKRYTGVQPPSVLANLSGYRPPTNTDG